MATQPQRGAALQPHDLVLAFFFFIGMQIDAARPCKNTVIQSSDGWPCGAEGWKFEIESVMNYFPASSFA